MLRRAAERAVYGFLAWFESFNSVWQTTLLCVAVGVFEIAFPRLDPHLIAVLVVSLYATFTQNGLAHENKLTSEKIDRALAAIDQVADETFVGTQTLIRFAENESHMQEAIATQSEALAAALAEIRTHLTIDFRKETP